MRSRRYKQRKAKSVLIFFLVFFLLGGIFYFLFFSQVFRVKNFSISGERSIDSEELKETINSFLERRWFLIATNNFFILKEAELEKAILSKFKRIEAVKIKKRFPNLLTTRQLGAGLKVEIKEKNLNLIWCQKKLKVQSEKLKVDEKIDELLEEEETIVLEERKCFYLDKDGMIFGKPFDIDLGNLDKEKLINGPFILVEEEGRISHPEERVVDPELIDFIFQIKLILPKIAGLKMVKGDIPLDSAGQINVETEEGWQVYFDTTRDLTSQVKILDLVLTEKIAREEREVLKYIDLRVPDRIYYK